ncbi:MAG TPA: hypothetical protein VGL97_16705 [Bryobacteraceae bacterium]|jgi:hypothetical protein
MASRLNLLFQTAPRQYLEKTVLFTDELIPTDHRIAHNIDIQPLKERSTARLLPALHLYSDAHLVSYFVPPGGSILIPKHDPPQRFVFLPEFTCSRLLLKAEGENWLRLYCEQGFVGPVLAPGSQYVDSFSYWDHTYSDQISGHLVGVIRATAVLVKEQDQPWTVLMQQIVGTAGFEVVRKTFSRALRY